MTLTPETRAENLTYVVLTVLCRSQVSESELEQCKSLIAQAITQGQDEKLEEAIELVRQEHDKAWGNPAEQAGCAACEKAISALKSQKD